MPSVDAVSDRTSDCSEWWLYWTTRGVDVPVGFDDDAGYLGGAVLDVTAIEPLPAGSPLWRHPKVLLTQHTGGRFPGETDRKLDVFLANFARFERGEPLTSLVQTERGY